MKFLTGLCAAARPMALPKGRPAHLYAGSSLCAQVRSLSVSAPVQGTARRLVYERPYERIPEQKQGITTPLEFIQAISRSPRRELSADSSLTESLPESWEEFFKLTGDDLNEKGVDTRTRKYILWAMERYRQGYNIRRVAYQEKSKKIVRGHGARVQKGYRVRGVLRPGEKKPPRNRRNMKRPY